ncbi:hypothetical protein PAPYR_12261 [Paratrimastix pyriformis]|uniref:Uncharacterized protein n=1 Tax=Paratrimastix pyriformis TaxID=342808 RepID=A0ABQ8U7K1_9EUKA|nr:hypothetical protein PAPYR_12261 [Paratrimastix pyriformis]
MSFCLLLFLTCQLDNCLMWMCQLDLSINKYCFMMLLLNAGRILQMNQPLLNTIPSQKCLPVMALQLIMYFWLLEKSPQLMHKSPLLPPLDWFIVTPLKYVIINFDKF